MSQHIGLAGSVLALSAQSVHLFEVVRVGTCSPIWEHIFKVECEAVGQAHLGGKKAGRGPKASLLLPGSKAMMLSVRRKYFLALEAHQPPTRGCVSVKQLGGWTGPLLKVGHLP
jgi:hypothetical protein